MYCKPEVCAECQKSFKSGNPAVPTYFCSGVCRDIWNNRRKLRGALLMDMMMILRFDREAARDDEVWTTMCRMASDFRNEDDRAGRASVNPRQTIKERTLEFRAVNTKIKR